MTGDRGLTKARNGRLLSRAHAEQLLRTPPLGYVLDRSLVEDRPVSLAHDSRVVAQPDSDAITTIHFVLEATHDTLGLEQLTESRSFPRRHVMMSLEVRALGDQLLGRFVTQHPGK